ncbi:hypothetical protein [Embleya sp. NPDC005971]|uniref:AbiJ-related protein n=1 Tax=Embleya sp. NPDC005971 TaxID=3156724 RepID=UPI0033C1587F
MIWEACCDFVEATRWSAVLGVVPVPFLGVVPLLLWSFERCLRGRSVAEANTRTPTKASAGRARRGARSWHTRRTPGAGPAIHAGRHPHRMPSGVAGMARWSLPIPIRGVREIRRSPGFAPAILLEIRGITGCLGAGVSTRNHITEVTRRHIVDAIHLEKIDWAGRLDEVDFLGRLYDLEAMQSHDSRYATASGDIYQHRYNNPEDWDDDWVFGDPRFGLARGSDDVFLRFLAEILHPVVRADPEEARRLARMFNDALAPDGWELVPDGAISGRPIHKARRRTSFHGGLPELNLDARPLLTDPRVLHEHLGRIRDGIDRDPAAAIGSCKELVESLCAS